MVVEDVTVECLIAETDGKGSKRVRSVTVIYFFIVLKTNPRIATIIYFVTDNPLERVIEFIVIANRNARATGPAVKIAIRLDNSQRSGQGKNASLESR